MFDTTTETEERGQVGIGTLIVFIALVLVAAIAAGVLINTAGFLQTQAQSTGEESTDQVSTNLVFLSSTGAVHADGDGIANFSTTIQLGPGSNAVNLNDSTVSVFTDSGASAEFDGIDPNDTATVNETAYEGSRSSGVLSTEAGTSEATATIFFQLDSTDSSATFTSSEAKLSDDKFEAGTTVDIVITTSSGTQAETSFRIEDPLDPQIDPDEEILLS